MKRSSWEGKQKTQLHAGRAVKKPSSFQESHLFKTAAADLCSPVSPRTSLECGCWLACSLYRQFVTTTLALTVGFDCALQWKPLGKKRRTSFPNILLKDSSPSRVKTLAETKIMTVKYVSLNFGSSLSSTCPLFRCPPCFYTAGHDNC